MEIKIRYTFKRKSDGHIVQEVWPIEVLEKFSNQPFIFQTKDGMKLLTPEWEIIGRDLWTGEIYKDGSDMFCGDEVSYKKPYRTTQTHYGDNIPNGEYTEPMEPGIKTISGVVVFKDGCFCIEGEEGTSDFTAPISWHQTVWNLENIREAISYGRPDRFVWDDPEEGDLQYLMEECAKVKTPEELIEYLNGFEKIGSIYTSPELLNK